MTGSLSAEYWCPDDMTFIRGIEFSCATEVRNCHILGYGYNKNIREWGQIIEAGRQKKRELINRHLGFLVSEFDIEIDEDNQEKLLCCYGNYDWKLDLGKIIVSMGKAANVEDAIAKYIKPCRSDNIRLDAKDVIAAILTAGGIPVWAHPYGGYTKNDMRDEEFEVQLQLLIEAGLQGVECFYSDFDEEQISSLLAVAKKNNLYISGGSDYHGDNKDIPLGKLNKYGMRVREEELTIISELKRRQKEHPYPLIDIEEWHNTGASFWFMPVKVKDLKENTCCYDNQEEMKKEEISVGESTFEYFLYPMFKKYFDKELPENSNRWEGRRITWFEWNLVDNFYTYVGIESVLNEIEEVADVLEKDYDDYRLDAYRNGFRHLYAYLPQYWHCLGKWEEINTDEIAKKYSRHLVDFYRSFVAHLRLMMKAGEEAGYKLISVCGP